MYQLSYFFWYFKEKSHIILCWFPSNSFSKSQHKLILATPKPGSGIEAFIVQAKPILVAVSACD